MKVGLVIPQFDPRLGGAEQWTWQFSQLLAAKGHEVHIVAERFGPANSTVIVPHTVARGGSKWGFAEAAAATLRTLSLDVIHDMGIGWRCDVFQPHGGSRRAAFEQNLLLCPPWQRPIKRRLARVLPRYRDFERLLARQYARDGRILVAISQMVARDFQRYHEVPPEQIRIVYNGVDCERFSPRHRTLHRERLRAQLGLREEVLFLIVAHNFELKGVPSLIRAVGRLHREGASVHLAVVGGKRVGWYRHLARRCGVGKAVSFLGAVADAAPWYAAADVYVQPTYYDPCSLVVLEAFASGLPVVTSRFNGAGELIRPDCEGDMIDDPSDDWQLAERMRPLLRESKRVTMGEAARKLALVHSLERNGEELIAVYQMRQRQGRAA